MSTAMKIAMGINAVATVALYVNQITAEERVSAAFEDIRIVRDRCGNLGAAVATLNDNSLKAFEKVHERMDQRDLAWKAAEKKK